MGPHHTMKMLSLGSSELYRVGSCDLAGTNSSYRCGQVACDLCEWEGRSASRLSHLVGTRAAKNSLCLKPFWGKQRWGSGVNEMNSCLQTGPSGGVCTEPPLPASHSGNVPTAGPEVVSGSGRLSVAESSCERALSAEIASLAQPRASPRKWASRTSVQD